MAHLDFKTLRRFMDTDTTKTASPPGDFAV